jgi:predicted DNA-binding transcriptional regulator YafY
MPALINPATPPHQVAVHWASAQPTLDQLETNVAGLMADAPDEARAAQARTIAAAVTQVRSSAAAHVALLGSAVADTQAVATSATALQTARSQLAAALGNSA